MLNNRPTRRVRRDSPRRTNGRTLRSATESCGASSTHWAGASAPSSIISTRCLKGQSVAIVLQTPPSLTKRVNRVAPLRLMWSRGLTIKHAEVHAEPRRCAGVVWNRTRDTGLCPRGRGGRRRRTGRDPSCGDQPSDRDAKETPPAERSGGTVSTGAQSRSSPRRRATMASPTPIPVQRTNGRSSMRKALRRHKDQYSDCHERGTHSTAGVSDTRGRRKQAGGRSSTRSSTTRSRSIRRRSPPRRR